MIGTRTWNSVTTALFTLVKALVAIAVSAGGRMKARTNNPTARRMIFSSIDAPALFFAVTNPLTLLINFKFLASTKRRF